MSFIKDLKHDIDSIKARDPAAKSAVEIVLTYSTEQQTFKYQLHLILRTWLSLWTDKKLLLAL